MFADLNVSLDGIDKILKTGGGTHGGASQNDQHFFAPS